MINLNSEDKSTSASSNRHYLWTLSLRRRKPPRSETQRDRTISAPLSFQIRAIPSLAQIQQLLLHQRTRAISKCGRATSSTNNLLHETTFRRQPTPSKAARATGQTWLPRPTSSQTSKFFWFHKDRKLERQGIRKLDSPSRLVYPRSIIRLMRL